MNTHLPTPPHFLTHWPLALALCSTMLLGGCAAEAHPVSPDAIGEGPARSANQSTASERWMAITRGIVGRRETGSPLGMARSFALVAVAQYNAAVSAGASRATAPQPSEAAAVSSASAAVLLALYPPEEAVITAGLAEDAGYFPAFESQRNADYAAGTALGRIAAAAVLARAATDRTDAAFTGTAPTGPGYWINAPPAQPVSPRWGEARPWMLAAGDQFRPAAPPAVTSAEFQAAIAEVRTMTADRNPAQLTIAQFWQFASGPGGPMGYFTELATGYAVSGRLNERQTARMFAVMHMAMMDATIGCWDAKYAFWYVRPFQADPSITTPVGRPNFPAYPSAHSCLSAAAGGVLAGLFPEQQAFLAGRIEEAGVARLYAGLHFRFDITAGQDIGRKVAALALTRVPRANASIPLN
jgi:membrane-associated phospholipid phosphatase